MASAAKQSIFRATPPKATNRRPAETPPAHILPAARSSLNYLKHNEKTEITMRNIPKPLPLLAAAILLAICAAPTQAQAWGRYGVFIGLPPIVLGGPLYAPPPVYEPPPPPPAYIPPPAPAAPAGYTCYAKPYICPLYHPHKIGHRCACEALGGGAVPGTVQ
jgi:hypothetical protein